jgi:GNAT superfamily N-acetyltransferase
MCPFIWTVGPEPVASPDAVALLRDYFAELTVRYFHRETTEQEIDQTLDEFPTAGLALFLVLRAGGVPTGCLGLHPTGELSRIYVAPRFRRAGGARALLAAAEAWARGQGLSRLFLDTRTDLVEARALYASAGFVEIPPATATPGPFQDHWFEKPIAALPLS